METVRASINRIVFSTDSGYKVLQVRTQANKMLVVTGEFGPEIIPEAIADFHGDFQNHPKYGHQFKTKGYTVVHDQNELVSIKIFLDNIAPDIGPERSDAIISHFENDVIRVLDEEPDRLMEVPGIGKKLTANLKQAWSENREKWNDERILYSLRAFLQSLGLKERRIKRVLSYFGGHEYEAEQKIRENPYQLIEIEGFGFTTVDFIARKLGITEDSPERLKAYIHYCLNVTAPSNGHLFFEIPEILKLISYYCMEANTQFLGGGLSENVIIQMIDEMSSDEKIIREDTRVYGKKQYFFEEESARLLTRILKKKSDLIFLNRDAVEKHIERFEHENNLTLSDEQRRALYYFAEQKLFTITGSAGTGKTTLLKAIVEMTLKMGLNLTCMTPTGISAKKLSTTINYDAYTIHRRLGFKGSEWTFNSMNKYNTDVIIIDEASMVDQEVLYRLLSAVSERVHIIFVGDHNQLPSVGAGNVLRELIHSDDIPVVILDKIFRQAEASEIIQASHRIIHGDTNLDLFRHDPSAEIFFMRVKEVSEIEKIITALAAKFKDEKRLFQIITPRNSGPLGVDPLNEILQAALNPPAPHLSELKCLNFILRQGDRVIVKKNDYENEIYNGDIGKVMNIAAGRVLIKIDDRMIDLGIDEIEDKIKLAYTLTVHRSQGQEYPMVILLVINQHGRNLLQRNLLYTAVTRAKEKVIVIGHGSAIERAINNTSVIKRNTCLGERIKKCLNQMKSDSSSNSQQWLQNSQDVQINKEPSLPESEESCLTDLIEK